MYSVHCCLTEEAFNVNWQNILLTTMADFAVEASIHFIFYLTTRYSILFLLRVLYERKNRSIRVSVSSELCIGCIFDREFRRISWQLLTEMRILVFVFELEVYVGHSDFNSGGIQKQKDTK
jgi:hypothetical protein